MKSKEEEYKLTIKDILISSIIIIIITILFINIIPSKKIDLNITIKGEEYFTSLNNYEFYKQTLYDPILFTPVDNFEELTFSRCLIMNLTNI